MLNILIKKNLDVITGNYLQICYLCINAPSIKIFSFNRRQRKERHNKTVGRADHSRGLWDSYLNVRKEAAGIPPADVLVRIGRDPSYHDSFRQMRKKAAQRIEACEEVREI